MKHIRWILSVLSQACNRNQTWISVVNRGIKHDFPFINICKVPREVLETEGKAQGFQHFPRDLANVNEI